MCASRPPTPDPTPDRHESPSPDGAATLSDAERDEARRYGRLGLWCDLADRAVDVAYLAVAALVLARPLDAWLARSPRLDNFWTLRLAVLLLIVVGLHIAVSFPLSFYSGYVLQRRFGLSRQTVGAWLWRYTKRNLLAVTFGLLMFIGLFWLIWLTGAAWWLVAAGAFFVVTIVLGQIAPVLIMPLFHKIQRLDHPELAARIAQLAEGTGLSIEGVYQIELSAETVKGNAMLAGLGRTRRVLLGDTLLDQFSLDELEVIFAHEIGHHVFRHIRKLIAVGLLFSAAAFWIVDRLLAVWAAPLDYSQLPVHALPLVMLALVVLTNLFEPAQNALSRRFERQCDRYALERTGRRDAYVSAFQKLARLNKDDPDPHWLEVALLHGHPPIAQRIAMADQPDRPR